MELKNIIGKIIGIRYQAGKQGWKYIFDIAIHLLLYALLLVGLIALITLISFGYVPVDGGGYNNPIGTITYVWGHGILGVSIPLAALAIAANIYRTIQAKKRVLMIVTGVHGGLLIGLNIVLGFLDIVAIIGPWLQF